MKEYQEIFVIVRNLLQLYSVQDFHILNCDNVLVLHVCLTLYNGVVMKSLGSNGNDKENSWMTGVAYLACHSLHRNDCSHSCIFLQLPIQQLQRTYSYYKINVIFN